MAYRIERKGHIVDSLTVADGDKELTISVDVNVDRILSRYNTAMQSISVIGNKEAPAEERAEKLGAAVLELFCLLFGEDQAHQITDFYQGRYTEMLGDFVPYITTEIAPKIRAAEQELADRYKALSKR